MADVLVGNVVAQLKIDMAPWQQGLQAASQQLAQFHQGLAQATQQSGQTATQLLRAQSQAATQAAREQMQAARLQAQESMQSARLASTERMAAARQASQAEILEFRRTTEAARQAFAQQREAARAAAAEARQAAPAGGGGLGGILQVAGGIGLATTIGGIVSGLKEFATSTVEVGARLEQLRASLSAIAGSTAAGQQQFQFLTATAHQLGVAVEPIARGWRQLTAAATQANLPLADQQRLFTALVTEARRVGASNEELNRALTAVAQTASKGKVSMEELRQQLGEALPTAFAAVARGMGRTTEELEKLIETGSVRFPAFARALTRGFEQMQAASGQMAETSQAAFNRLANAWTQMQDTIMKSGLNTYLVTVANNLREAVEWTSRLLAGRPTAAGPTMGELGATPAQAAELRRLQGIIGPYSRMAETAENPAHRAQYAAMVERTREQLDQLLAVIRGTQDQAVEQARVTAEVNKTTAAQQLQADYVTDITKKLGELRKAQEDYRKEAALAPERMGRPGTEDFLKGMEKATRQQLEGLTTLAAQPPQGVTLPENLRQQLAAEDIQFGKLGQTIDALKDKEQAAAGRRREAAQAARQEARELEQDARAARRERLQDLDIFGLMLSPEQEAQLKDQAKAQRDRVRAFAESLDIFGLALPPEVEAQRRAESAFDLRLRQQLDQQRTSRLERPEARLRAEMERTGVPLTAEREAQLRQMTRLREEQERLNLVIDVWRDLSMSVGSAWTSALSSIAAGTATVSEAFQMMAQSILKSMSDIAANQAFQAIFKLGVGLLTTVLTPGPRVNPTQYTSPIGPGLIPGMAEGGLITTPTLIVAGERGPEHIVPAAQMAAMQAAMAPQGGAQDRQVIVNNFPSRQAAEEDAARQRSQGHKVIVNAVLENLSAGEASEINRALRSLQR